MPACVRVRELGAEALVEQGDELAEQPEVDLSSASGACAGSVMLLIGPGSSWSAKRKSRTAIASRSCRTTRLRTGGSPSIVRSVEAGGSNPGPGR